MRATAVTLFIFVAALLWLNAPVIVAQENPELLVKNKCTYCHSTARICKNMGRWNDSQWRATVERMVGKGARADSTEQAAIASYLVTARTQATSLCGQ